MVTVSAASTMPVSVEPLPGRSPAATSLARTRLARSSAAPIVSVTTSETRPRPNSVTCTLVSIVRFSCSMVPASNSRPASTMGKGRSARAMSSCSDGRRQVGWRVHSSARPRPAISALVIVSLISSSARSRIGSDSS